MSPTAARTAWAAWRREMARNYLHTDPHLQHLIQGDRVDQELLEDWGATCAALDPVVRENNRDEHLPRLRSWSAQGERVETIDHHESHHILGRAVYGTGVMARFAEGRELEAMSLVYLYAQHGEAGHNCPLACTAGLIRILQQGGDPQGFLPALLDPDYDTHMHGAQFLTEAQGGSDVGANAVHAQPQADGTVRLVGEKWFCSVADAQLMLVSARPTDAPPGTRGVRGYAVPRHTPDGRINGFAIRRLKYKLGTRSMASAEIDFEGATAYEVGDFRAVVGVVLNTSRLFNAINSAASLQRAAREATVYARHRQAFGGPIARFPSVGHLLADLHAEAFAARESTFFLVARRDAAGGQLEGADAEGWRMLVNLNKYWTSAAASRSMLSAIEVLGGNGAIEDFSVLPRLLRDAVVCEQWEGPHNVLVAQVLRDAQTRGLHHALLQLLCTHAPHPTAWEEAGALFERLLAHDHPEAIARPVFDALRRIVQGALLDGSTLPAAQAAGAWLRRDTDPFAAPDARWIDAL